MSILFVGTSISDFEITGPTTVTTTATQKAANVSEGFCFFNASASQFAHARFAPTSDIWISFDVFNSTSNLGNANSVFAEWGNSGSPGVDQPLFRIKGDGAGGCTLEIWNGSTWIVGPSAANLIAYNTRKRVDLHIKMADTGGVFSAYVDGTLASTHTATDTILTAATTLDFMRIRSLGQSFTVSVFVSGVIIADEDTRNLIVAQSIPSAAGNNSAWAGLFSAVDETGFDDTDYISSDTLNAVSTFATPILPAGLTGGLYTIVALAVSGRVSAKAGRDVAAALYTNSATYAASAGVDAALSLNPRQSIFHTNPATSVAWTPSEASACQIGLKVINHA
jgi:hypothetical protein